MKLTQEQIDQATKQVETHLNDIGLLNNFTLLRIDENLEDSNYRTFVYEVANPTFKTCVTIAYNFGDDGEQSNELPSFSWMDYKKITE